jgi:DNA-binding NarL/FixJ family response regulator
MMTLPEVVYPVLSGQLAQVITEAASVIKALCVLTSNKVIASQPSLSEVTVKCHMKSILSKLGANDRTHAVTIATKRGFLDG